VGRSLRAPSSDTAGSDTGYYPGGKTGCVALEGVVGTPHERFSEQVTAIVVPARPGVTAEDIAAYCQSRADLRGLNRPRRIEIVDSLPRTGTNKIDKPALKARFADLPLR